MLMYHLGGYPEEKERNSEGHGEIMSESFL